MPIQFLINIPWPALPSVYNLSMMPCGMEYPFGWIGPSVCVPSRFPVHPFFLQHPLWPGQEPEETPMSLWHSELCGDELSIMVNHSNCVPHSGLQYSETPRKLTGSVLSDPPTPLHWLVKDFWKDSTVPVPARYQTTWLLLSSCAEQRRRGSTFQKLWEVSHFAPEGLVKNSKLWMIWLRLQKWNEFVVKGCWQITINGGDLNVSIYYFCHLQN